jgi:Mrp family chromosome partitioning ATPase
VLEGTFDFVLVDSPPTLPVVDAAILAMHAHGTILVVGENGTRRAVIDAIAELGGEISGCVLNEFEIPGRDYDSYGYLEPANEDAPEADKEEGATAGTEAVRKRLRFLPGRRK